MRWNESYNPRVHKALLPEEDGLSFGYPDNIGARLAAAEAGKDHCIEAWHSICGAPHGDKAMFSS